MTLFCGIFQEVGAQEKSQMASIYDLKPGQLLEIPKDDKITKCKMCLQVANPGIDLGPLYQYGHPLEDEDDIEVYCAHYFCLLFAPGSTIFLFLTTPSIVSF